MVADSFEVGHDVGGEQHADLLLGHSLHQHLQELPSGQRVQARDRLVEDQQLGPLGQPQRQRELGRWPPDSWPAFWRGSSPRRSIRRRAAAASHAG